MFRNDDPSAVATQPTVPAVTGTTPGYFTPGNPAQGQQPTKVPFWWLNMLQEELLSVLGAAGITPTKGNNGQLLAAMQAMFSTSASLGLGTNAGWYKTAAGIIFQWNTGVTTTGNQDFVAFPISFPVKIEGIYATEGNAVGWSSPPTPTIYGATRLANNGLNGFWLSASQIQQNGVPRYANGCTYAFLAVGY